MARSCSVGSVLVQRAGVVEGVASMSLGQCCMMVLQDERVPCSVESAQSFVAPGIEMHSSFVAECQLAAKGVLQRMTVQHPLAEAAEVVLAGRPVVAAELEDLA